MSPTLKIGTRTSLLAMAQSRLVARQLRKQNPGLTVELVGIQTRGDRTLDVPLSQMEGKEFFVAELDAALLNQAVDCTVHSTERSEPRPTGSISLAAIPTRENPRDIVLYSADIMSRLRSGAAIRIGTSSPRRMGNVPAFLANALPQFGVTPQLVTREIRGNVHTRIGLLTLPADDPRRIDAVVLAFAGLIRLWNDPDGRQALSTAPERFALDGLAAGRMSGGTCTGCARTRMPDGRPCDTRTTGEIAQPGECRSRCTGEKAAGRLGWRLSPEPGRDSGAARRTRHADVHPRSTCRACKWPGRWQ